MVFTMSQSLNGSQQERIESEKELDICRAMLFDMEKKAPTYRIKCESGRMGGSPKKRQ